MHGQQNVNIWNTCVGVGFVEKEECIFDIGEWQTHNRRKVTKIYWRNLQKVQLHVHKFKLPI